MSRSQNIRAAFVFVSPAAAVALAISGLPLIYIFYTSLDGPNFSLTFFGEVLRSRLFSQTLSTTLKISFYSSTLSLLIGYIVALHLARQSPSRRTLLLTLVLLPFWTSVLVKCFAFTVILGRTGIINSLLSYATGTQVAIPLVLNRVGVMVGMTNYLAPFVVFPILASLLAIDSSVYRAAQIVGARPARIFWTVTLPLSMPGVFAAASSAFVMALSFFIIPALLGGPKDAMLSNLVDFYTRETLDWNMASAVGVLLLGMVLIVAVPFLVWKQRASRVE